MQGDILKTLQINQNGILKCCKRKKNEKWRSGNKIKHPT